MYFPIMYLPGKRNGAAALLKEEGGMRNAIVMHCHDHRLALACRDAFASIPQLDTVAEGLESLFKYYKYSSVSSATLRSLQEIHNQAPWRIQQAKHHRWLSHDKAVGVVLKGLNVIRQDLENASTGELSNNFTKKHQMDARALHKWITSEKTLRMLCLLGDILPHLAELSLVFQRRSVDVTFIEPKLQSTLAVLERRKTESGKWEMSLDEDAILMHNCNEEVFRSTVKVPFIDALKEKLELRFQNIDVISQLGALSIPIDVLQSLPPMYREEHMRQLAGYFGIDELLLLEEWVGWLELLQHLEFPEMENSSSLPVLSKLLLQRNSVSSQDLARKFPNLTFLYSVVYTMFLSSAEVERLFSHVNIIKNDRRSSLSNKTLNCILNIKLNIDDELAERIKSREAKKWLHKKMRRFGRHM